MATVFIDGFDKYGPVGQTNPTPVNLLTAGEWTSVTGTAGGNVAVVSPLSFTGYCITNLPNQYLLYKFDQNSNYNIHSFYRRLSFLLLLLRAALADSAHCITAP